MIEYDFSKCMYDISGDNGSGLLKRFPELNAYEEFIAAHNDNEIKIAMCLTDNNSPFLKIKDYKQKVIAIFSYLEMNTKNTKTKQLFDEVMEYRHERTFAMCAIYLQMQNDHDFTYWWNMNQLYYSLMVEMGKPRGKDEDVGKFVTRKLSIQRQADPIKNDLLNVEANLFADSKMKAAIAQSKIKKLRTFPEMYADLNSVE